MTTEHVPMLPRVAEIFAAIKAANDELATIREACPHSSFTPGWWNYGMGRLHAVRICDRCRKDLPGITIEERAAIGPLFQP